MVKDFDVSQAIHTDETLQFLKLDFPRKPIEKKVPPKKKEQVIDRPRPVARPKPAAPVVSDDKAITRFFAMMKPKENCAKENIVAADAQQPAQLNDETTPWLDEPTSEVAQLPRVASE